MSAVWGVTEHARERMAQHYGRDLGDDAWRAVLLAVLDRRSVLLRIDKDGREIHALDVAGSPAIVVWDPATGVLVTTLPPDAMRTRRTRECLPLRRPSTGQDAVDRRRRIADMRMEELREGGD